MYFLWYRFCLMLVVCSKKTAANIFMEKNDIKSGWTRGCPSCGKEIRYKSIQGYHCGVKRNSICLQCLGIKQRKPVLCMGCGVRIGHRATRCRKCYKEDVEKRFPRRRCSVCDTLFKRDSENTTGICSKCYTGNHPFISYEKTCISCGKNFMVSGSNQKAKRYCNSTCAAAGAVKSLSEFILGAEKVHRKRYDYSRVAYVNAGTKVEIGCLEHGPFWTQPNNHLRGRGCPKCAAKSSKKETRIREWLERVGVKFEYQKRFSDCRYKLPLSFDFWIPEIKVLIEYDGEQHFNCRAKIRKHQMTPEQFETIKRRDKIKDDYAKAKGIKLIRIPYTVDNVEAKVEAEIREFLGI